MPLRDGAHLPPVHRSDIAGDVHGESCAYVPLCGGVQRAPASALALFGIPSPFAYGVQNFSINYITLNNSYNSYFSLLSGINSSNYEKT